MHAAIGRLFQSLGPAAVTERSPRHELVWMIEHVLTVNLTVLMPNKVVHI